MIPIVSLHEVFLYDTPLKLTLDHAKWVFFVINITTWLQVFIIESQSEWFKLFLQWGNNASFSLSCDIRKKDVEKKM